MPVTRLNHAVFDVRDEQRSVAFYQATLGFTPVMRLPGADALVGTTDHGTTKALYAHDPGGIGISIPVAR